MTRPRERLILAGSEQSIRAAVGAPGRSGVWLDPAVVGLTVPVRPRAVRIGRMQAAVLDSPVPVQDGARRPTVLALSAVALLAASVILHVVAVFPPYYRGAGQGSLWSEPDQAAQYLLLAGGWALALGMALSGPARARLAAALAVGLAAAEFGFRVSDLGEVCRYGSRAAGAGLWLMIAAWVAGAAGAVLAVLAVRARRHEFEPAPPANPDGLAVPSVAGAGADEDEAWRPAGVGGAADRNAWASPAVASRSSAGPPAPPRAIYGALDA